MLSTAVNQKYLNWFLSRNNSIQAVFSVLAAPSAPFPHLRPQKCNTRGRAVNEHSPPRIQGCGILRPALLTSYVLSPLPPWSSIASVPTCWHWRTQLALVCLYLPLFAYTYGIFKVLWCLFSDYKSHTCSSLHKSQVLQKCVFFENMSLHPSKPYTDFTFVLNKKQSHQRAYWFAYFLPLFPMSPVLPSLTGPASHHSSIPAFAQLFLLLECSPSGICMASVLVSLSAITKYHKWVA